MKKPRKNLFTYSPNHFFTFKNPVKNLLPYSLNPFFPSKPAFTLAEVLITLGIIGVVAAITIPTLIANINSHRYRSQFKKSISTLSQAGRMSIEKNGFTFSDMIQNNPSICSSDNITDEPMFCNLMKSTLSGMSYVNNLNLYLNNSDVDEILPGIGDLGWINAISLADGTIVAYFKYIGTGCQIPSGGTIANINITCYGFIDVNGTTLPNKQVTCTNPEDTKLLNNPNYAPCVVKNDSKHMTDIYPIVFHDDIVEPATNAAKYVLSTAK